MIGIGISIDLGQTELTPQVVNVTVVVDTLVFPTVSVPEGFEGIRLSTYHHNVPSMRIVTVSPCRDKIHGNGHSQRRKQERVIPAAVHAQAMSQIFECFRTMYRNPCSPET